MLKMQFNKLDKLEIKDALSPKINMILLKNMMIF